MKNLIILFLAFFVVSIGTELNAQVSIGLKAGLNGNNIRQNFADSDDEMPTKLSYGFHAGLVLDVELADAFSIQPGALFSMKGFATDLDELASQFTSADVTVDGYQRASIYYVEVPLNLVLKLGPLQLYGGPYAALAVGGKMDWDFTMESGGMSDSDADSYDFKPVFGEVKEGDLGDDEDAISALDYGVNAGIGVQAGPVVVSAGYSLGLANLQPAIEGSDFDPDESKAMNGVITLSLTLFFGD